MNGRPWSADDTAILRRMASSGYSDGEIAAHLGRERTQVCRKRAELKIERGVSVALVSALRRVNARRTVARV